MSMRCFVVAGSPASNINSTDVVMQALICGYTTGTGSGVGRGSGTANTGGSDRIGS